MQHLTIDLTHSAGKMKPMHAVNNGPVYKFTLDQRISNLDAFRDAGIPYARTHDASFYSTYGGEHTVDVHAIFPDFSKDPCDPASYDFTLTDEYLRVIDFAGVKTFYRLGSKIEHWPKKYGTLPPADFQKWAVICEHIMRHYLEGWADGYRYDMEYWEIWNEPDGAADDADIVDKKTWGGTQAQFFAFYDTAARHLKTCFPQCRIGGPAVCYPLTPWVNAFLKHLQKSGAPFDFFSWHCYCRDPHEIERLDRETRKLLDECGFTKTESILNEWNYVRGWNNDDWIHSLKAEKSLQGSSFIAGTMALSQYQPLDLLMYYDARPCGMNGMFATDFVCDKLKGYYPFWMFGKLYRLGEAVPVESDDPEIMLCGAKSTDCAAAMITYYRDTDTAPEKEVRLTFAGLSAGAHKVAFYLLDAEHDAVLTREEIVTGQTVSFYLKMRLFTTIFVDIAPYTEE